MLELPREPPARSHLSGEVLHILLLLPSQFYSTLDTWSMTISLERLPYDVQFQTASFLEFDDIVHLSYTCRQTRLLLEESTLCRKAIEAHAAHSKEAQLARSGKITYGQAVKTIYNRRSAFSNAYPFSARIVGQGNAFCYRQGVLCILQGSVVLIMDIHSASEAFRLDLGSFIMTSPSRSSDELKFSLLYYSDGILAVHCRGTERHDNGSILAIDIKRETAGSGRLIKDIPLESSSRLFVRLTANFLYYGTYSGRNADDHHEWEIWGYYMDANHDLLPCGGPLQLEAFYGNDIGSEVAFEIHDGDFYAVSNRTSFDIEEVDWTSFYHCIRFPLDSPRKPNIEINEGLYRRQHKEGPIHDSWTDLTIQVDESSHKPFIVEARREWKNGTSRQSRAYYITEIDLDRNDKSTILPEDDPFTGLVRDKDNPNYGLDQPRKAWQCHPEFGSGAGISRSFILARTKFRAYNHSCSSFIDLVEDEKCCGNLSADACLRIRIGSRRPAPQGWTPPDDSKAGQSSSSKKPAIGSTTEAGDVVYRNSPVKMWPPVTSRCPCSKRLHGILSPRATTGSAPSGNRTITGVVDEGSLVYMVKSGRAYGAEADNALGTVVLVNFNRSEYGEQGTNSTGSTTGSGADENMESERRSSTEWYWSPGQLSRCERGVC